MNKPLTRKVNKAMGKAFTLNTTWMFKQLVCIQCYPGYQRFSRGTLFEKTCRGKAGNKRQANIRNIRGV